MSGYIWIFMSASLTIYHSVNISMCRSLSIFKSVYLSIYLSIYLSEGGEEKEFTNTESGCQSLSANKHSVTDTDGRIDGQ